MGVGWLFVIAEVGEDGLESMWTGWAAVGKWLYTGF
jgi:hypothetical protein